MSSSDTATHNIFAFSMAPSLARGLVCLLSVTVCSNLWVCTTSIYILICLKQFNDIQVLIESRLSTADYALLATSRYYRYGGLLVLWGLFVVHKKKNILTKVSYDYILASCCTVLFNEFWGYVAVCVQLYCRWFTVLRLVVAVLHCMAYMAIFRCAQNRQTTRKGKQVKTCTQESEN
jgi:hypothetical protein